MINHVALVGRLTKDPELRKTKKGTSTVSYTLACNRRVKTPGQPDADFISCVAWNKTADLMAKHLHKGSLIGVTGHIQTRHYDNQQGQRVYITEVVTDTIEFLEPKNTNNQLNSEKNTYKQNNTGQNNQYTQPAVEPSFNSYFDSNDTLDISDDDLPF